MKPRVLESKFRARRNGSKVDLVLDMRFVPSALLVPRGWRGEFGQKQPECEPCSRWDDGDRMYKQISYVGISRIAAINPDNTCIGNEEE